MDKRLLSLQYSFFLCLAIAEAIWGALTEKLYEKSGLEFLQLHKDCRTPCTFYNFWDEHAPYHVKIIPKITSTCTTKINEDTAFQNYRRSFQNSFFSFFQPLIGKILIFSYKTRVVLIVIYCLQKFIRSSSRRKCNCYNLKRMRMRFWGQLLRKSLLLEHKFRDIFQDH